MTNTYFKGVVLTLLSALFWGFSGTCGQFLISQKGIDASWLTSVRLISSGAIMLVLVILRNYRKITAIFSDKISLFWLCIYAVFGLVLCQYTYFATIKHSNAAIATVLQYTAPAIIIILVCIYERKLPSLREFIGLIFASAGIFVLATHLNTSHLVISYKALFIGLSSALCITVYTLAPIKINKKYGYASNLALGLFGGGILFALITQNFKFQSNLGLDGIFAIAIIVIFGTILAFSLFMLGVTMIGPKRASLLASIEPVSSALLSHFWLGTQFYLLDFIGFLFIMLCATLLSKR